MKKMVLLLVFLLSACAGHGGSSAGSGSSIEMYGTIDAGVGYQHSTYSHK